MKDNIIDPEILKQDQQLVRKFRISNYQDILTYSNEMGFKGWQILDKKENTEKHTIDVTYGKTKGWEERDLMFQLLGNGSFINVVQDEKGNQEVYHTDGEDVEILNYVQIQGLIEELKDVLKHKEPPENLHKMLEETIKEKRLKDAKKRKAV